LLQWKNRQDQILRLDQSARYRNGWAGLCPRRAANKKGVVWHNDAGEKDETVFKFFIGVRNPK